MNKSINKKRTKNKTNPTKSGDKKMTKNIDTKKEQQTENKTKTKPTKTNTTAADKKEQIKKIETAYKELLQTITPNKALFYISELDRLKKLAIMFGATKEKMIKEWHFEKSFIEFLFTCRIIKQPHKDKPAFFVYDKAHQTDKNYSFFSWNKFYFDLLEIVN